jgi:hypothetical protein
MPVSLSAFSRSLSIRFYQFSTHVLYTYTVALDKLSLHFLCKKRHHLDTVFVCVCVRACLHVFRSIAALNPALPFWKMLAFVFLLAILGHCLCIDLIFLINTVLLLGAPMLPTWWVKILAYMQLQQFQ